MGGSAFVAMLFVILLPSLLASRSASSPRVSPSFCVRCATIFQTRVVGYFCPKKNSACGLHVIPLLICSLLLRGKYVAPTANERRDAGIKQLLADASR